MRCHLKGLSHQNRIDGEAAVFMCRMILGILSLVLSEDGRIVLYFWMPSSGGGKRRAGGQHSMLFPHLNTPTDSGSVWTGPLPQTPKNKGIKWAFSVDAFWKIQIWKHESVKNLFKVSGTSFKSSTPNSGSEGGKSNSKTQHHSPVVCALLMQKELAKWNVYPVLVMLTVKWYNTVMRLTFQEHLGIMEKHKFVTW